MIAQINHRQHAALVEFPPVFLHTHRIVIWYWQRTCAALSSMPVGCSILYFAGAFSVSDAHLLLLLACFSCDVKLRIG